MPTDPVDRELLEESCNLFGGTEAVPFETKGIFVLSAKIMKNVKGYNRKSKVITGTNTHKTAVLLHIPGL